MRLLKRTLALLLSVLLLVSLCGCSLLDTLYPEFDSSRLESAFSPNSDKRSGIVDFEQMEYVRPDIEKLRAQAEYVEDLLDGFSKRKDVVAGLDEFFELYRSFDSMMMLAVIRSDIDTDDEYYLEENSFCTEAESDVERIYDELMLACSNSSKSGFLDAQYFGGLLAEEYSVTDGSGYTPSDELVDLLKREAELKNDYSELYIELNLENDLDSYKKHNKDMGEIYIELIKVRREIAELKGFDSYEEYAYRSCGRSYSPDDLADYTQAIKDYIVPVYKKASSGGMYESSDGIVKTDSDTTLSTLTDTVRGLDGRIDETLDFMLNYNLYDISASDSKYNQAYVAYLDDYDSPYLFVCPSGYSDDILTVGHEFGHYVDRYLNYDMNCSLDSSEMFSQGMEYLIISNMASGGTKDALTHYKMLDTLSLYIDQASFNEFEQRAFALKDSELTVEKLNSIYEELSEEYGFRDEYGDEVGLLWISIPHLFTSPYYVISYCVSDSAAFALYNMELKQKGSGLDMYMKLIDGASVYEFLELLNAEGMDSPITAQTVKAIADTLSANLKL